MSVYVDKFIRQHSEYFKRNKSFIQSNKWNVTDKNKEEVDDLKNQLVQISKTLEGDVLADRQEEITDTLTAIASSEQTTKSKLFKQEHELTTSIVGRLTSFIKTTEKLGDRGLPKTQKFIDETVNIINIFIKKCDDYLAYKMDTLTEETSTDEEIELKSQEIKFQDVVFGAKIKIQDNLSNLNIEVTVDNLEVNFFKDEKASLILREPLTTPKYYDIKEKVESISVDWNVRNSKEMFINMNPKDIPHWNHKKHFFDQDPVVLQFWSEELNKIIHGININGFYVHPWLYFHLNFFRTPIPQEDGTESPAKPDLRDNEWFFSENLKACISEDNPNYYSKAMLVYGTRRFGKALRNDQDLYYTDGNKRPIGQAKEGDKIFGSDGLPTNITGVYPQGKVNLYELELSDGRKSICCDEHLWTVYDYQAKKYKTLPLKEIMNDGWFYSRKTKNRISKIYKYFLPINKTVQYNSGSKLEIDPYYLGLWLGDGSSRTTAITTEDKEIEIFLENYAKKLNLRTRHEQKIDNKASSIYIVGKSGIKNKLFEYLKDLKVINNKHIPTEVLLSDEEYRLEVLQGLMDSDGTINSGGSDISFTNANKILAKDVLELVRSLGIHAKLEEGEGNYIKLDGELNSYSKVLMYTDKPVFKLQRKLNRIDGYNVNRKGKIERVPIINIKRIEDDYATCIRVDNESREFLTNDFIVTHNSVILASLAHWKLITKYYSNATVVGGSSSDLNALTSKVQTSMDNIEAPFRLDTIKQNWDGKNGGETTFGIKEDASTPIIYSSLIVQNLEEGQKKSKSQKTAGGAPSVSIYDEIGKYPFLKAYLAALPSFATPYGFKCVTVLAGTGGESDLSADAVGVLSNPELYDLLPMNWDLLENHLDPDEITWKRRGYATFFPGQMAYEKGFVKEKKNFGDWIDNDAPEFNDIDIHVTNWKKNNDYLDSKLEKAKKDKTKNAKLVIQQRKVQYPRDPEDTFMSGESNKFPTEEAQKKKKYLEDNQITGELVTLYKSKTGRVETLDASDKEIPDFPFQGGFSEAPVIIYERPHERVDESYLLYIAGLDDYNVEESGGDSLGSFCIYKRNLMDESSNKIVAMYTARPDPHKKFHEQGLLLLQMYNAKCYMENVDTKFKDYLDGFHLSDTWLVQGFDPGSEYTFNTSNRRKYGWQPTDSNVKFMMGRLLEYCYEVIEIEDDEGRITTQLGVERIDDISILNEIIGYNKDGNFDRLTSFGSSLMYDLYLTSQYITPKLAKPQIEDSQKPAKKRNQGGLFGSSGGGFFSR